MVDCNLSLSAKSSTCRRTYINGRFHPEGLNCSPFLRLTTRCWTNFKNGFGLKNLPLKHSNTSNNILYFQPVLVQLLFSADTMQSPTKTAPCPLLTVRKHLDSLPWLLLYGKASSGIPLGRYYVKRENISKVLNVIIKPREMENPWENQKYLQTRFTFPHLKPFNSFLQLCNFTESPHAINQVQAYTFFCRIFRYTVHSSSK